MSEALGRHEYSVSRATRVSPRKDLFGGDGVAEAPHGGLGTRVDVPVTVIGDRHTLLVKPPREFHRSGVG